jgi:hypothetical protein
MRKIIDLALAAAATVAASAPAFADSKSSAEFMLTTCLAAMDELAKVEVIAQENNWTTKTPANGAAMSKFVKSVSIWEVMQGEDKFTVAILVTQMGENIPPRTVCSVLFPSKNVKREEFFNWISASVELTFRFSRHGGELYELKSDRTNKLMLAIQSQSDGTVTGAVLEATLGFAPRQTAPAASPEVDR